MEETEIIEVTMSEEQMDALAKRTGDYCLSQLRIEHKKNEELKKREQKKQISQILKSYRKLKIVEQDSRDFSEDEKREIRWKFLSDLVGNPANFDKKVEDTIIGYETRLQKNRYSICKIEQAMQDYESAVSCGGREEDVRRFKELKAMYIDGDKARNAADLAEEFGISEKTLYRDLKLATSIFGEFLLFKI